MQQHEGTHHDELGDMVGGFGTLDRGFGRSVAIGYAVGFFVILGTVMAILAAQTDLPFGVILGAAIGVAVWIGVMGGVVAVGVWSMRHEKELFGH